MESGVAGYLHKKFKKQSTIDYKIFKCDIENGKKEQCNTVEEPRIGHEVRKESSVPDCIADNNAKESDESTNQNSVLNFSYCNNATSSISVKSNTQSTGPCISYVETFRTDDRYSPRTDRTYYDRFTAPDSSVATTAYSKDACSPHKEDISYNNNTSRFITNDETLVPLTDLKSHDGSLKSGDSNSKYEETPALQDKPTGGKYVCTYCNLGCSKPSVLQKHIRAHTNERPYPCISCGFSFKTRSNLYKHCRSRTHANRVMGNKVQEIGNDEKNADHKFSNNSSSKSETEELAQDLKLKPYKPRFHNAKEIAVSRDSAMDRHDESSLDELNNTDSLSHHINEIISKNNSIVHSNNHFVPKLLYPDEYQADYANSDKRYDEPLNLTNKNRKRCVSEVQEPITQKSLIKELLLKNLYAETMQCRYCKMIFQTVTELELHKLRSCKGFTKPGLKYTRSSSVNVASILTQNKNAFDDIPQLQNSMFPLKSPGPFLGNIRLVDREKTKSFSYEDVQADTFSAQSSPGHAADRYLWGLDLQTERDRKPTVKLFGGEVKIANTSSECYKMDSKVHETFNSSSSSPNSKLLIEDKLSKNHVVKSGLQSGGTVLTNKTHYSKQDSNNESEGMNIYKPTSSVVASEPCDGIERNFSFNPTSSRDTTPTITIQVPYEIPNKNVETTPSYSCLNIVDFSQKALKMLTPNIKRPNLNIINASKPVYDDLSHNSSHYKSFDAISKQSDNFVYENKLKKHNNTFDPMHLVVNGRVVRYVPGMPGPVIADEPVASESYPVIDKPKERDPSVSVQSQANTVKEDKIKNFQPPINFSKPEIESKIDPSKSLAVVSMNQIDQTKFSEKVPQTKFARPNSLALKPSSVSLKQHHGLTPTMFNQILISPDTPRVAKKYVQQFLHGNYFSYLGLKSTTKPVYCTLNKTQPFYTPHFKKLSMYSEWRQQDNKTDKLFVSSYDSRQRQQRYSMAGKAQDLIVHSSYKFILTEVVSSKQEKCDDKLNSNSTTGTCGYESKEDYTYIRGRGRGRYVCDQCGIRCKKPSMLKKHIKTHSDDRPYTCSHCNFSFKTKGNLTKHMKSKVHTKNSTSGSGNSSSSQQNLTQSSESESEDSDAESSDESTRQQEHEAAYGLLTLAQKTTTGLVPESQTSPVVSNLVDSGPIHSIPDMLNIMDTEEIVHVTKINYAKNKILDQQNNYNFSSHKNLLDNETKYAPHSADETSIARPLTYPYTSVSFSEEQVKCPPAICPIINSAEIHGDSLSQFPETTQHLSDMKRSRSQSVGDSFHRANLRESYDYEESGMMSVDRANSFSGYKEIDDRKKRKIDFDDSYNKNKVQKSEDVMDLSIGNSDHSKSNFTENEGKVSKDHSLFMETRDDYVAPRVNCSDEGVLKLTNYQRKDVVNTETSSFKVQETHGNFEPESSSIMQYDNSAMETLADIATKQDKLEKNTLAKSVATEYLKLATKNEYPSGNNANIINIPKDVNELIVKPEGSKSCSICSKSFSKSSQLKLHMNIHYIERPYRCESCSVSFRSKGHLQKHERSASHHNKLTSSPAQVSSEPRPFKCLDCKIAFRIPGHLAKHLRSKMHIMKLECLAKIPFGLYAELERSNNLLTEINTVDGDQCLESLRVLAKKIFFNDPNKLNQLECPEEVDTNS